MRFDGDRMQLMVEGEEARVRWVETRKAGAADVLVIEALISGQQMKAITKAWNDSFDDTLRVAFNGGRANDARFDQLKYKNQRLEQTNRDLLKQLAKRTLFEVADLPDLDYEEPHE